MPPEGRVRSAPRTPARRIPIHTKTITLGGLLKWAGLTETGGAAKELIGTGRVHVNGESETRRGRQLRSGDTITIVGGPTLLVVTEKDASLAAPLAPRLS